MPALLPRGSGCRSSAPSRSSVTITQEDLVELPDLTAYGEVDVVDDVHVREVASAAPPRRATGLEAPLVDDLPEGVTGQPAFEVVDQVGGIFTFSADEAQRTAAAEGGTLPRPPAALDGSRFRLEAGPGLAAIWSEERAACRHWWWHVRSRRRRTPRTSRSRPPATTWPELLGQREPRLRLEGVGAEAAARLAVEPGRISLEERLLDILRAGSGGDQ